MKLFSQDGNEHQTDLGKRICAPTRSGPFQFAALSESLPMQIPVSQLMRVAPAAVVSESTRLREAAEILVVKDLNQLVVTDSEGRLLGMVPESAVIRRLMTSTIRNETVSPIISRHVETVRCEADLNNVLHLFRSSCHAVIPVVNEDRVVLGLLHRKDVVRYLLADGSRTLDSGKDIGAPGQKPHFMDLPEKKPKASPQRDEPRE